MDCETCKEKRKVIAQTPKDVPYIAHESAVARLERVIKRIWVLVLALIILLCASNAAWIWYESQFEEIRIEQGNEAELMSTLQVINPRLYAGVIKKLKA